MQTFGKQKPQQGFSLIEVLVAGLVITVGLVGMVMLQVSNQQSVFRNHQLTLSGLYAQDMQERLRSNVCYLNSSSVTTQAALSALLEGQKDDWEDDHRFAERNWSSSWENLTYDLSDIEGKGYWQFDLRITPPAPSRSGIVQSLLIDYRASGCNS